MKLNECLLKNNTQIIFAMKKPTTKFFSKYSIQLLLFLVFIFNFFTLFAQKNTVTPFPEWVQKVTFEESKTSENGAGYRYLLIDLQDHIVKKTVFRHFAIKILNEEGIQSMSDLDFSYDPSYQKLILHKVQIIRNGAIINKINDSNIQTIHKETNSERSIYDGSLSTIINLTDVRKNDIIEYAYSIIGFNPINKGNYGNTFYQKYTSPVNKVFNRIVTNSKHSIQYKLFHNALEPEISTTNNETSYVWSFNAEDFELYDNNTPAWFDAQKRVSVSTFNTWKNVVDWALPLFKYNKKEISKIELHLDKDLTKEQRISKIIQFVQDDIRYLGFESGISAYKPHSPKKVYKQRYGDCKDKSLLLVALLRKEGVAAFPLLVNTTEAQEITKTLPSNHAFDHCVVAIKHNENDYFVDPTISNQGGDLAHISFPNYAYGLLIKNDESELLKIPTQKLPALTIHETITIDSIGGNAKLKIVSNYTSSKADYMRSYFKTTSKESIHKEYLNFYSSLYPNIELLNDVKLVKDYRDSTNKITTEENYLIENFWLHNEGESNIYCETYPLILETLIDHTNSAERTMPYYLGEPQIFTQKTTINISEEWPIENTHLKIEGDGFKYENLVEGFNKSIVVTHNYTLTKATITGDKVNDFLKKHENIQNKFSYYLLYNKDLETFKLSWVSIVLAIITLLFGLYVSIRIYRSYNPAPLENNTNLTIGGWLILPAIGIVITAFVILFQLFSEDFFNHNTWLGLLNSDLDNSYEILFLVGAELVYNLLYLVFTVLLILLFFTRRSNIPRLISIFYIVSFVAPLIDTLVTFDIFPEYLLDTDNTETYKDITRSAITAIIWIPYFHMSKRVKNTFIYSYKND